MTQLNIPRALPIGLLFISLLAGCCGNIQCECATPSIDLTYSGALDCGDFQNLVEVSEYNSANDALVSDEAAVNRWGCTLSVPYRENRYWVVASDSLNLSDTLRLRNVTFESSDEDSCCDCAAPIESAQVDVNGQGYWDTEVELSY